MVWFGFLSFLIPVFIFLNILSLAYWLFKKSKIALLPALLFLYSLIYFPATFAINWKGDEGKAKEFSVLSFNVSFFNVSKHWVLNEYNSTSINKSSIRMKEWVRNNNADIKCFQEFYDHKDSKIFNISDYIAPDSCYYQFVSGTYHPRKQTLLSGGVAIFSKYPIYNKGIIFIDKGTNNRGIFADVVIGDDTIRIINVHLHSMRLKKPSSYDSDAFYRFVKNIYMRLKDGLLRRNIQADKVYDFVQKSPYRVILCGDFNETPYGYVYQRFNAILDNSFEKAGFGFGFSLNNSVPFLRIDNQFYDSKEFKAIDYVTFRNMPFSEHFPIQGTYLLKPKDHHLAAE